MTLLYKYPREIKPGDLIDLGWSSRSVCIVLNLEQYSYKYKITLLWWDGTVTVFDLRNDKTIKVLCV